MGWFHVSLPLDSHCRLKDVDTASLRASAPASCCILRYMHRQSCSRSRRQSQLSMTCCTVFSPQIPACALHPACIRSSYTACLIPRILPLYRTRSALPSWRSRARMGLWIPGVQPQTLPAASLFLAQGRNRNHPAAPELPPSCWPGGAQPLLQQAPGTAPHTTHTSSCLIRCQVYCLRRKPAIKVIK